MNRKSIIISLSGYKLTNEEKSIIVNEKPWGIILFKRNIKNVDQVKFLTNQIRKIINDPCYPVIIDEEGDRVSRISNLFFTKNFSQNYFAKLFKKNRHEGKLFYIRYLIFVSNFLNYLGINVNTIPVLDIFNKSANKIIGNRSFSNDINTVNILGKVCIETLKKNKIGSVSKHIPGHGKSLVDTHNKKSTINKNFNYLIKNDFKAFSNLKSHFAMTAHIIYKKIDPDYCATHSSIIINKIIRQRLLFKGILISDDISMKSLSGNLVYNAKKAISSGCNLVLYCSGKIEETKLLLRNIEKIDNFTIKKTSEFYKFLR
tara:strand:- start:739 stop:1686 length:948 start_codon:yes stop_codon:yes gene_type:complete